MKKIILPSNILFILLMAMAIPMSSTAMKLIRVCGPDNWLASCTAADIIVNMSEECTGNIPITLYLSNITSSQNTSGEYNLPANTPAIHLRYEYSPGVWLVSEELIDVEYKFDLTHSSGPIMVFGIDVNLTSDFSNEIGCNNNGNGINISSTIRVEVVTPKINAPGEYELFPILDYAEEQTGIFSSKVFDETKCVGDPNSNCSEAIGTDPVYDYNVCLSCNCKSEENTNWPKSNPISGQQVAFFEMMPNPFNDVVKLQLSTDLYSSELIINIYNSVGEIVYYDKKYLAKGKNNFILDTSKLTAGSYYFVVDNGIEKVSKKMILIDK